MQQQIEAIVMDAEQGKLRVLFAGDLCQALLAPVPRVVSLGCVVTLRIRVRTDQGGQVFEGAARVVKLDGGTLQAEAIPLRRGLMIAFEAPTFVRRETRTDPAPLEPSGFALPPDTLEERAPWSEGQSLVDETVRLPIAPYWTGDTAKVPTAPRGEALPPDDGGPNGRFTSLDASEQLDEGRISPWDGSTSSII